MGDKQRTMEEEEEEKEKPITMVRHSPPVHPLPEEIEKMDRSETVCRYCGVSYLIYHEFHQLNTRLAQLETELEKVCEAARREKARRESLELSRLEWETALNLQAQRKADERETSTREELEEKRGDAERLLGEENRRRRELEEDFQKTSEEKERTLRSELRDSEVEGLRRQREELENRNEEREKVLSDALHRANQHLDELRKDRQQAEERLAVATSRKDEAEQSLKTETQQGEILRGVCVQQVKALRATRFLLRSCGGELTEIRGFLGQLTGAWQAFTSQTLQHSARVLSELEEELRHCSDELRKATEAREKLTRRLMQQSEEQLSRQRQSETELRGKILRLEGELEEKHGRWLSCQQRCDAMREQLSSWQQRQRQTNRKCCAAEEEGVRLREALEKAQQEAGALRKERDALIDSHSRALEKMVDDCRQQLASKLAVALEEQRTQSALQLGEQMEEFRREVQLERTIDREKNQLLLLHHQRDSAQLLQKLEQKEQELGGLREELRQERRSREEERKTRDEQRRRSDEERQQQLQLSHQQEALQLSQLEVTNKRNAELLEEVTFLQETVRRECQEREELTDALSTAQVELLGLRSPASHQASTRSPPNPTEGRTPPGNKHFHLQSQARAPLTRSPTSPNVLRAGNGVEAWNGGGFSGEEKPREGTLPRLRANGTAREGRSKLTVAMWRKERQEQAKKIAE